VLEVDDITIDRTRLQNLMKDLVIIYDYFSPAYKAGGPIQSLSSMVGDLGNELDIKLICSNKDADGERLNIPVDRWVDHDVSKVFYSSTGFWGIRKIIDTWNAVFFINGMYSLHYNFLPVLLLKGRKIVSSRGMLSEECRREKWLKKKIYLQIWKLLGLHSRCEFHATTETEKRDIENVFGSTIRIWVIPNLPVEVSYKKMPDKIKGSLIIATVALISPLKNHKLVLQALMLCNCNVIYNIYGPVKEEGYWQSCRALIAELPVNVTVNYHGGIEPDKVAGVIAESHVYVQPSLSENFGHSLIEALFCGRPVITSHNTPWDGLESRNAGFNVPVDGVKELHAALEKFAEMDLNELETWSHSARQYAIEAVDMERTKQLYLDMFTNSQ